jgi:hypothetical protein
VSDIKIDLKPLFEKLIDKAYCVIKLPDEFPQYKIGSDLDIFCYDVEDTARIVLEYFQEIITNDLTLKIINMEDQIYIDVMDKDKINFRFDLYGALPAYKNILIKEDFFSSVIENSLVIKGRGAAVKVPSKIDESILRYIEYHEWYEQRPDKIKHIDYLEEKFLNKEIEINKFLDKLHYYTKLPKVKENRQVSSNGLVRYLGYLFSMFKKVFKMVRERGLSKVITLIIRKIKK